MAYYVTKTQHGEGMIICQTAAKEGRDVQLRRMRRERRNKRNEEGKRDVKENKERINFKLNKEK